jgi:transcriptional regulator with XRE-family HTH domain
LCSRNQYSYLVLVTERQARDEGALQTTLIMEAVKRLRTGKGWSAQQLADEMTKAGVPWNADIVVNLEHGRRKSLRVHELLALAWVLDADSPLDLLIPGPEVRRDPMYPVTPSTLLDKAAVRAWWKGETGSLREWLAQPREGEPEDLAAMLGEVPPQVREQIIMLARSSVRAPRAGDDGQD